MQYFGTDKDTEWAIPSMRAYVERRQEIDKALLALTEPVLAGQERSILDAACGIGHLAELLLEQSPRSSYLGIDQTDFLIEEARDLWRELGRAAFAVGEVQDLPAVYPQGFDVVINHKTLSWLPNYDLMLPALMELARGHLFLTSLFYEGDIDFAITVTDHARAARGLTASLHYNVYSLPRFVQRAHALGASDVRAYPFEIGIDLQRPADGSMGTYTELLADGRRLQVSGAVVMSWKLVRIDR